ncbi:MAG: TonB-dependent receptor family protein, partial [Bacteroidota bacterium]|nr:TonB-dependent receptor family protein [Bacteroidota bacterium]
YFALFLLLGTGVMASAQKITGTVKGSLQDSISASPLEDATVSVMRLPDSTLISFTLSRGNGYFEIKNLDAGDYQVVASFTGLRTFKRSFSITAGRTEVDYGLIKMERADKALDEIVIVEAPVKINGDTVSFKADAFKTKPNATVEDLLKKLPGVQVDRDGTVKAQGENVQKVYVDGKEFFGNDPKLATKNLTAEMVDRVDVFDDMSEQAKFNGIDDGSRSKAINLKLKKDKKKGIFGRATAGYGSDQRYDANVTANYFKGATQANIIAKSNNTNNMSFTQSDMMGMLGSGGSGMTGGNFGGGGMMMGGAGGGRGGGMMMGGMGMGGGGFGGMNMGTGNTGGITTSSQAGLNYRDTWSKTFDVNGSYFFNYSGRENQNNTFRQNFLADSSIFTQQNTTSRSTNYNNRANLNMTVTIDSFNSVIFQPNISFQKTNTLSDGTLVSNSSTNKLLNQGRSFNTNEGEGYNWNNNLLWRHKFRKLGRTLSVNLSNTLANNDREGFTISNLTVRQQDQMNVINNQTNNYSINASFTEAIARDKILELNYNHTDNRNRNDRRTYVKNMATGRYEIPDDAQTNYFDNANVYDRYGTNLRIVKKKYNYQLGFAVQKTSLESNNLTTKTSVLQNATNFFPMASFNYQFQRSRSLRFNYRGRTNQPTASQLQDVENRDNFPYITKGNPFLRQEFTHNLTLSYNFFDVMKFRNFFAFLTYNTTQNRISNAIEYLPGGVQVTKPQNVSGVYSVSGNINMGLPIRKMQGGNFNTNTRIAYNQDANLINNIKNYNRNLSVTEELRLSYNYKEALDLGLSTSVTYNQVRNTVQKSNNANYFTHVYSADITYTLPKNFILATDVDYTFN